MTAEVCCGRLVDGECCGRTVAAPAVALGTYRSTATRGLTCEVVAVEAGRVIYESAATKNHITIPVDVFLRHWRKV